LAALRKLPESPTRARQELPLQITLGIQVQAAQGFAASELEQAFTRARVLCKEVSEVGEVFPVLWGLWTYYAARAESRITEELTEQLRVLAHGANDPVLLVPAHLALLEVHCVQRGDFAAARQHLEQGMALYDPRPHREEVVRQGRDPGLGLLGWGGWALHVHGYPDQARQCSDRAIAQARAQAHPHSLAWVLSNATLVDLMSRDMRAAGEHADELVALATEQGFPSHVAVGMQVRGLVLVARGSGAEGLALLREGWTAWRSTGALVMSTWSLGTLAEALGKVGQVEEGLATVAEGLAFARDRGEHFCEAELHRLRGELLLLQPQAGVPQQDEAEGGFREALAIARRQQAKSWELRAVMSLARLYQRQGRGTEARPLLAETYGWFTEGFETPDLKEAQALLGELA
jgi:predicted ATPase